MIYRIAALCALLAGPCLAMVWGPERGGDQCKAAAKEVVLSDSVTTADDTPSRLHYTWLSQECEVRAGPEYVIRKYTFFKNGTFLLLRYHYAEESCSVATHTITARGVLNLLLPSILTPGATEAKYQLDTVHIVPLNRQVAHKFSRKVNISCSLQPRWRPYVPQLIYEQSLHRFSNPLWEGPRYNSLQSHPPSRSRHGFDCLEPLGIEFEELRLVRVQRKPSGTKTFGLGFNGKLRIELLLGSLSPNVRTRWTHVSTSLQSTPLLRMDTTQGCPVCSTISRGTESSPPVLHEIAALPALLGGSWLSSACESFEGGLWLKRQLQVYPGDKLWTGRWDYYVDPTCSTFLYGISAAGSYIQRAGRQRRHGLEQSFVGEHLRAASAGMFYPGEVAVLTSDDLQVEDAEPVDQSPSQPKWRKTDETEDERNQLEDSSMWSRRKRDLAEWMTPELARKIFRLYGSKSGREEEMLPTVEELKEAIGKSKRDDLPEGVDEVRPDEMSILETLRSQSDQAVPEHPRTSSISESSEEGVRRREREDQISTILGKLMKIIRDSENFTKRGGDASRRLRRNLDEEDSYRHLLQNAQPLMAESFAAMLRGNQRYEETTRKPAPLITPTGTTELDLHVAESLLLLGNSVVASRCGSNGGPLTTWPRNCVPYALEAPSTLGLRARVGVSWSGQYTLTLGPRDDNLWDPPLHQCGPTPSNNPKLRSHLRRSVGLRYGLFSSSMSSNLFDYFRVAVLQILCCWTYSLLW